MSDEEDCVIVEDKINYKSISCEDIPEIFLDKLVAKKHFGTFGKINRFILRPKRLQCTVEYETEEDAEKAFVGAGVYNGLHFLIKYTQNEVSHARNTEEWVDADVQAELDAMGNNVRIPHRIPSQIKYHLKTPKTTIKSKSANEQYTKIDLTVKNELESILKRQAVDLEDKYRILDARDKLIRLTTVRTTDIKKAVSTKGSCPDMCPEKERLMREVQHQVSVFELEEGSRNVMNHQIAIKEYSRSSADQEAPLSHELRPERVLRMAMSYLMHKIMGLCDSDVNLGDWYHFVWDRTRSIRKDITQQELCSLEAVQLVEQCARFHIHCAARLIAEDPSVFDQKINTENLTKCLQTLKYMYHDLRLKNIKCPNEAEFRAYVILLNLNDTNFLWEVKQLPPEIQNSQQIRFSLSIYLSMESNNYVKFFRLLRETTYMNACILLRYFTQVRIRAVRAIIKAYNWPRHFVSIPLSYLKNILAFESEEAASRFFEYYGLDCYEEKVLLDRRAFYIPDMPFLMSRALDVVEAKKTCSVGEAVCGQTLDPIEVFENHVPYSSFDEDGYLKPDAWSAKDQIKGIALRKNTTNDRDSNVFKIPTASPPVSPKLKTNIFGTKHSSDSINKSPFFQPIAPTLPAKSMSDNKSHTSGGIVFGNVNDERLESDNSFLSDVPIFSVPIFGNPITGAFDSSSSIFGGTSVLGTSPAAPGQSFIKDTKPSFPLKSDSQEEKYFAFGDEANEEKKKKEIEALNQKKLAEEKEERRLEQLKKEQEQRKEEERLHKLKVERERQQKLIEISKQSNHIWANILSDVVGEDAINIARDEFNKYRKFITQVERITDDVIEEFIAEYLAAVIKEETSILTKNQCLLQKYFVSWKENTRMKIQRRKMIEATPIWISDQSLMEHAESVAHPQQNETLEMMQRYRLGVPGNFNLTSPTRKPFDVFSLCSKIFNAKMLFNNGGLIKSRKYFKLVISLPQVDEELEGFNSYINSWLQKNIIVRQQTDHSKGFLCETHSNLSICIRKVEGILPLNEQRNRVTVECDQADGIIFVMTCSNLLNSRKRLHHLLKLSKIYTKVPVAIIIYNATAEEELIEAELQLTKLVEDEKISFYSIFSSTVYIKINNLQEAFKESFKFLAKYSKQKCKLEMQNFCSYLRTTLGDEFWRRLQNSWLINPSFRKICTQPQQVVKLYNEALNHLFKMIEDDYDDYPEFPQELKEFVPALPYDIPVDIEHFPDNWKDESRNENIVNFFGTLKLNAWHYSPKNLGELEQYILDYSKSCITNTKIAEKSAFTAIKHLLENINHIDMLSIPINDRFQLISWLNIIEPIALGILTASWSQHQTELPKEIIYKKSCFREFISTAWWYENESLKCIKMQPQDDAKDDDSIMEPPDCKKPRIDDLDDLMKKSVSLIHKADNNIQKYKEITTKSREIGRKLDLNLYRQEMVTRNVKKFFENNV